MDEFGVDKQEFDGGGKLYQAAFSSGDSGQGEKQKTYSKCSYISIVEPIFSHKRHKAWLHKVCKPGQSVDFL